MPYNNNSELPEQVRGALPQHAQEIYRKAFNSAWEQYEDPEERRSNDSREKVAHRVAWSAVKESYEKRNDKWQKKES